MLFHTSTALLAISFASSVQAVTLFEGLVAANASKFADFIQSDPSLVAVFTSPDVKTIFAPHDDVFEGLNNNTLRRSLRLFARQSADRRAYHYCSSKAQDLSNSPPSGDVTPSKLPTDGGGQSPIVAKRGQSPPAGNSTAKRQLPENRIHLFTGLGNNVTVLKENMPYDGGLIHTIDG